MLSPIAFMMTLFVTLFIYMACFIPPARPIKMPDFPMSRDTVMALQRYRVELATLTHCPMLTECERPTLTPPAPFPRTLQPPSPPRPLGMPSKGWLFDPVTGAERPTPRPLDRRPGLTQGLPLPPRHWAPPSPLLRVADRPATVKPRNPLPRDPRTGRFLPRKVN